MVCGRGLLPYAVTHLPPAPARAGTSVPAGAAGTAFPWQQADGRTDCRHLPCTDTSAWWEPSGAAGPGLHRPLVATSPDSLARLRPPPPGSPSSALPAAPSIAWCPHQPRPSHGALVRVPFFSFPRSVEPGTVTAAITTTAAITLTIGEAPMSPVTPGAVTRRAIVTVSSTLSKAELHPGRQPALQGGNGVLRFWGELGWERPPRWQQGSWASPDGAALVFGTC